jgi:hypothetical protein
MTSSTTQPVRGASERQAEDHGYGLVLFASVLQVIIGCFNLIFGIGAIANSYVAMSSTSVLDWPRMTASCPGRGGRSDMARRPTPDRGPGCDLGDIAAEGPRRAG